MIENVTSSSSLRFSGSSIESQKSLEGRDAKPSWKILLSQYFHFKVQETNSCDELPEVAWGWRFSVQEGSYLRLEQGGGL